MAAGPAASLLSAAERTGAVLVTMSNLYGYGPVSHPMTEHDSQAATGPKGRTRAAVWAQALAAHLAGRVRVTALARIAAAPAPRLRPVPSWQVRALGLVIPYLREFGEVGYQFTRPFIVDSAAYQDTFGAAPTPIDQALTATLTWWHDQGRAAARRE